MAVKISLVVECSNVQYNSTCDERPLNDLYRPMNCVGGFEIRDNNVQCNRWKSTE